MPLYEYKCPSCQARFERVLPLARYAEPQTCSCGAVADKLLSAPAIFTDFEGYRCPVSGDWIEGRKAHEENLKKHGCRVLEPGEREQAERARKAADEALEKSVEDTAGRLVASLPQRKLEKLASELEAGVTATVVRQ